MPTILFYIFAILMIAGGICVVALKNPVASAMGMIGSFIGIAALLIGLNAFFVGTLQVLVYAGAIMVLFIFIIMLLDLKKEEKKEFSNGSLVAGIILPLLFVLITLPILSSVKGDFAKLDGKALVAAETQLPSSIAENSIIRKKLRGEADFNKDPNTRKATLPDVNLIGHKLYTDYNFPLQVVGVLLLVATIGCVTLSKKLHGDEPEGEQDVRMAKTLARSNNIPQVNTTKTNSGDVAKTPVSAKTADLNKPVEQVELTQDTESATKVEEPLAEGTKLDEKLGYIYEDRPDDADDLVTINGVGPVLEGKLNSFGVFTFKQIANWTPDNVAEFDDLLSFKGRINRDDWISQAAELYANKSN